MDGANLLGVRLFGTSVARHGSDNSVDLNIEATSVRPQVEIQNGDREEITDRRKREFIFKKQTKGKIVSGTASNRCDI